MLDGKNGWWRCECDCGNTINALRTNLISRPGVSSCGCQTRFLVSQTLSQPIPVGTRFGRLTVQENKLLRGHGTQQHNHMECYCVCDCGTGRWVPAGRLKRKSRPTRSCGCSHNYSSTGELDMFHAIQATHPDAIHSAKGIIASLHPNCEFDVYIPSLKVAVEFDGRYWHSFPEAQARDDRKNRAAAAAGITLLRVPEADYRKDPVQAFSEVLLRIQAVKPQNDNGTISEAWTPIQSFSLSTY